MLKGNAMIRNRDSISQAKSYEEIAGFWDTHDLSDFWKQTREAHFDVQISTEVTYYALDKKLSDQLQNLASRRGVTANTLVNLWVQEKLRENP
jgi:hypothetical protein